MLHIGTLTLRGCVLYVAVNATTMLVESILSPFPSQRLLRRGNDPLTSDCVVCNKCYRFCSRLLEQCDDIRSSETIVQALIKG